MNILYPIKQGSDNSGPYYEVCDGTAVFKLSETGIEPSTSLNPSPSFLNTNLPIEATATGKDQIDYKTLYNELKDSLSIIIESNGGLETTVLTLWILGTYCFKQFSIYPNLWFFSKDIHSANRASLLLRQLCYNGILISPNTQAEASTRIITDFTPTLIVNLRYRTVNYRKLFVQPNLRDETLLLNDFTPKSSYCPKIIVSTEYPSRTEKQFFTVYNLKRLSNIDLNTESFAVKRYQFMMFALTLNKYLTSQSDQYQISPLSKMALAFTDFGLFSKDELDTILKYMNDSTFQRLGLFVDDDFNILQGIQDCICDPNLKRPDGYIPSLTIVEYLRNTDLIGAGFDVKSLRRLISKYGLLLDKPKRIWTQSQATSIPIVGASSTSIPKQITTLKIDLEKLNQLLN